MGCSRYILCCLVVYCVDLNLNFSFIYVVRGLHYDGSLLLYLIYYQSLYIGCSNSFITNEFYFVYMFLITISLR